MSLNRLPTQVHPRCTRCTPEANRRSAENSKERKQAKTEATKREIEQNEMTLERVESLRQTQLEELQYFKRAYALKLMEAVNARKSLHNLIEEASFPL